MRSSVVIVSYRPDRWLRSSIESAAAQADEVVLVDNASPGEVAGDVGRSLGAKVIRCNRNTGFAGGVNIGIRQASGDIVALLNDDAVADEGWLASAAPLLADRSVAAVAPKLLLAGTFAEVLIEDPPHRVPGDARFLGRSVGSVTVDGEEVLAGVVGGMHPLEGEDVPGGRRQWRWTNGSDPMYVPLSGDAEPGEIRVDGEPVEIRWVGAVVNNAGSYLDLEGRGGDVGYATRDDGAFDKAGERFAATGAAMVVRAETFHRLGAMARDFFAYYEDTDWCWRARLAGMRIHYEPTGVVRHIRSASTGGESSPTVRWLTTRNHLLCVVRNAPMTVVRDQLERTRRLPPPLPDFLHAVNVALPEACAARLYHARHWRRTPTAVFKAWAGVDNRWGLPSHEVSMRWEATHPVEGAGYDGQP